MSRPRLLLGPELLYASAGHLVWHHGVVDGPRGVSAVLEVLPRPAGDPSGVDLSDDVWRDFGREVKAVSALAYGDGAPDSATIGCFGSERRRSYTLGFGDVSPVGLRLDFIVRPLGLHVLRQLPDTVTAPPVRNPGSTDDPLGPRLAVLRHPEVLHLGDGCVIWHYGVVEDPSGVSVLVEGMVDPTTRSLGGRSAMESDAWAGDGIEDEPLDVRARVGSSALWRQPTMSWTDGLTPRGRRYYWRKYHEFGPDAIDRSRSDGLHLEFLVRPLNLRLRRDL